jgi:ABC-type nitrate/sulfonate/bicarbonate transport system substrate-binding protein
VTIKKQKTTMMLPRREVLLSGGMGALGMAIGASAFPFKGAYAMDAAAVQSSVSQIRMSDWNANYAAQWSWRLAQFMGFFESGGINDIDFYLTEEYFPGLIGGSLDIAHSDVDVLFGSAAASGKPLKLMSVYRDKEWWIMGVGKGIETFEDLKGGKISGGGLGGRNTWIQRQILIQNGIDPDKDVEMVPMKGGSDVRMKGIIADVIQGGSVFPRHEKGLLDNGGKFIEAKQYEVPQEGFITNMEWGEKNQDALYAWQYAELKARQWLHNPANKDAAYAQMREKGFEIPPEFEAQYEVELDQISKDGGFTTESMDGFAQGVIDLGQVPADFDWRDHVDLRFLYAAQDALDIPRRPS